MTSQKDAAVKAVPGVSGEMVEAAVRSWLAAGGFGERAVPALMKPMRDAIEAALEAGKPDWHTNPLGIAALPLASVEQGYGKGRRDVLNAILALNPKAAQRLHMVSGGTEETFANHDGRLPFDVVFWVTEVAEQLGIEPKGDE